jgi:succinate dehydrogenase/fumarate reductase flavoprotein subunit
MSDIDESTEKKGLTRRAFLGHTAVGAAGVAVGSSIAGVPSALASGSDWSQVDAENIVWDKETDILFVGTGYAALCGAIEAFDAGVTDILVIDKATADTIGGNSILCSGAAQFAGTHIEKEVAQSVLKDYPDTAKDSAEWMIEDTLAWGDYRADPALVRATHETSADTVLWLEQHLGLKFKPLTSFQYGMRETVARTHTPAASGLDEGDPNWYPAGNGIAYWYVMYNYLKKHGITLGDRLLAQHKAVRFIQAGDDGPVVGMEVQDLAAGKTLNIRTRKGVFLGAGGWKSNVAMRVNWDPRLDADFSAGGLPYVETTGEMIMAANDIGADLKGMDYVAEYRARWGSHKYQTWAKGLTSLPKSSCGVSIPGGFNAAMCVAADGKRFIDEYTSNLIDGQDFIEAFARMTARPRFVWCVMDDTNTPADWKTQWATAQTAEDHDTWPCVWKEMMAKGETLEALADAMGLSASAKAAFVAEVAKYNGYVDAKVDADFARPAAHMTAKIAKGPFWAVKAQFFAHDQMSGVAVNTKGQVIKRSAHIGPDPVPLDAQEVIPRLYAAGEIAGGYYGNERGHGKIGIVMNAGRIVGKAIAKEAPVGAKPTALAVKTSKASAVHGQSVTLTGVMSGAEGVPAGAQVKLQVRVPGKSTYATVAAPMTMTAARTMAASYKLAKKGTYSFRMQFPGTTSFAPCTSNSVAVVAK